MAYDGYNPWQYQQPRRDNLDGGQFRWVSSREEAEAYPLAPNGAVMLMNRNETVFYLKSCDAFGMPQPLREFPYSEKKREPEPMPAAPKGAEKAADFVSRQEFESLRAEIDQLKNRAEKPVTAERTCVGNDTADKSDI